MSGSGITEKIVGESIVALGGNYFESGIITIPAGATIKKRGCAEKGKRQIRAGFGYGTENDQR